MTSAMEVDTHVAGPPESPASKSESATTAATTPAKEPDDGIEMPINEIGKLQGTKESAKKTEKGTPTKGGKKKSTSIPYTQVIHDAIIALKDRTGSSSPAIQKWIMNNHPTMDPSKLKQKS